MRTDCEKRGSKQSRLEINTLATLLKKLAQDTVSYLSFHQIEHQRFIFPPPPLSLPPGDRYAPEPRSRSSKPSGWSSSHYDEDPRGPIGEYHDDVETEENGYKDDAGDEHRTATQG